MNKLNWILEQNLIGLTALLKLCVFDLIWDAEQSPWSIGIWLEDYYKSPVAVYNVEPQLIRQIF